MEYILMHKNVPVLSFDLVDSSFVGNINEIYSKEHVPVGVPDDDRERRLGFQNWWKERSIPASRENLRELLLSFQLDNQLELLPKCYGLSLSDCYWVKKAKGREASLKWDDINFYSNAFSDDVGKFLTAGQADGIAQDVDFMSPSPTPPGELQKKWSIREDGVRIFLKGGRNPYQQEPFNEVHASKIFELTGVPHAEYTLCTHNDDFYSVCPCIASDRLELVPAVEVFKSGKRTNSMSYFDQLFDGCSRLGMPDVHEIKQQLGKMFIVDYMIANTDRHLNNFAFLRNPDTLAWQGFAPVYDSGTSMFCQYSLYALSGPHVHILDSRNIPAKPFAGKQSEMIKRTLKNCSVSEFDFSRLGNVSSWFSDLFSYNSYIESERNKRLSLILKSRIAETELIVNSFLKRSSGIGDGSKPASIGDNSDPWSY